MFFDASVHSYVTVCMPHCEVSIILLLSASMGAESNMSSHVAPSSAYVAPLVTVTDASPIIAIAGGIVSLTRTVRVICSASLPAVSLQSYVTV